MEKVSVLDGLAKERVAMALKQSKERREKAEAKLAEFLAHVEGRLRIRLVDRILIS